MIGAAKSRVKSMTGLANAVIDQALKLKASERAAIVERLLLSVDVPNEAVLSDWLRPEEDAAWSYLQ